jgi:hypothetical protein
MTWREKKEIGKTLLASMLFFNIKKPYFDGAYGDF